MLTYILLIVGFILLIKGADLLVDGASSIARTLKVSDLVIGLTEEQYRYRRRSVRQLSLVYRNVLRQKRCS